MTEMDRLKEALIIFIAIALVIGLMILHDNEWDKTNGICNSTCIKVLNNNQTLIRYAKDSMDDNINIACECHIRDCKNPDCSAYEVKTLYTNTIINNTK